MQFDDKLYFILEDLKNHKRTRSDVFQSCVEERLDKALSSYIESLDDGVTYLSNRDNLKLLKKLSRGN